MLRVSRVQGEVGGFSRALIKVRVRASGLLPWASQCIESQISTTIISVILPIYPLGSRLERLLQRAHAGIAPEFYLALFF